MTKMFVGLSAVLIVGVTTCVGCGAGVKDYQLANPYYSVFEGAKQSFVKIETEYEFKIVTMPNTITVRTNCSGTIVRVTEAGSYVLTANHCTAYHDLPPGIDVVKQKTTVLDIKYKKHDSVFRAGSYDVDVSLIFVPGLTGLPAINLALSPARMGESILNIAAPAGFYPKAGVVMLQSGYYVGSYVSETTKQPLAIYSLLAYGGASGSMILNTRGELIGMLHSAYTNAPIISRSPTMEILHNFLLANWDK